MKLILELKMNSINNQTEYSIWSENVVALYLFFIRHNALSCELQTQQQMRCLQSGAPF